MHCLIPLGIRRYTKHCLIHFTLSTEQVSELALLFRALRDFNIPKIVGDDWIVFNGLLGDLFPGMHSQKSVP